MRCTQNSHGFPASLGICCRTGSSDEVALLIAEFGLLDRQQSALLEAVAEGRAALMDDDDLDRLAVDIPDLRTRLGIGYAVVWV